MSTKFIAVVGAPLRSGAESAAGLTRLDAGGTRARAAVDIPTGIDGDGPELEWRWLLATTLQLEDGRIWADVSRGSDMGSSTTSVGRSRTRPMGSLEDASQQHALGVMLIEDDEDEFILFRRALVRCGVAARCHWEPDPERAIERLASGEAAILFCDYVLGSTTGLALIPELGRRGIEVPTVLLTHYAHAALAADAAGVHCILPKAELGPATLARLLRELAPGEVQRSESGDHHASAAKLRDAALEATRTGVLLVNGDRLVGADTVASALLGLDGSASRLTERLEPQSPNSHDRERSPAIFRVTGGVPPRFVELRPIAGDTTLHDASAFAVSDVTLEVEQDRLLRRTWKEMEAFADGASHDLRAPLRKVVLFSEALLAIEGLDEHEADCARRAVRAARELAELVDALLEYAHAGNHGRPLAETDFDLHRVVTTVLHGSLTAGASSPPQVATSVEGRVRGNIDATRKIVAAVVANATRFVAPGATAQVEITATTTKDRIELRVADNGIGIDPAHAARVFEPFERLRGRSEYPGHGLGLATARRWAQRIGGDIRLERSTPGHGSTFLITLAAGAA